MEQTMVKTFDTVEREREREREAEPGGQMADAE